MSTAAIVAACAAAAVVMVVVVAVTTTRARRRHVLQQRFGPEYDRAMLHADSRRKAERELHGRLKRHQNLQIVPLSATAAADYLDAWHVVQQLFVDRPVDAVREAHRLVTSVMGERGYPADADGDERTALLSVDHADVVDRFRAAGRIERLSRENGATTEQLRQAFRHYRALFERLIATPDTAFLVDDAPGDEVQAG